MSRQWSSPYLNMQGAKLVLDSAPHFSSTEALSDLNWMNLSTKRQMQRCFFMYNLINDNDRNNMIIRGVDYHIRSFKSSSSWGLLRFIYYYYLLFIYLFIYLLLLLLLLLLNLPDECIRTKLRVAGNLVYYRLII